MVRESRDHSPSVPELFNVHIGEKAPPLRPWAVHGHLHVCVPFLLLRYSPGAMVQPNAGKMPAMT